MPPFLRAFAPVMLAAACNAAAWGPGYGGSSSYGGGWQPGYGGHGPEAGGNAWSHLEIKSLVTFGDSYTDESRLAYFIGHNGAAPPTGTITGSADLPVTNATASGGYVWDRYVTWYLSQQQKRSVNLYDYAVSGAVCSNNITPRFFELIHAPFPDIEGYEIPAFYADYQAKALDVDPSTTAYAMWIGTNDLGIGALLDDSQVPGKTVADYLDCVYSSIDKVFAKPISARYFVLFNIAPLDLVPMYQLANQSMASPQEGYNNITEIHYRMQEQVRLVNEVYDYRTQVYAQLTKRWPGMHLALFDVHDLLTDIYYNPTQYLNGTAPANVTGYNNHCNIPDNTICYKAAKTRSDYDSFEWYDPLHPSEQTDRVIAKEFVSVIEGRSKYASYLS